MPLPTKSDFENFSVTDSGAPYVVYAVAPTQDFGVLEGGAPFVVNDVDTVVPTQLWGAAVVRTVGGGATATTINHFGSGIAFVVATGFLDISTSAVELWGEVPVTLTALASAATDTAGAAVTTADVTVNGGADSSAAAQAEARVVPVTTGGTTSAVPSAGAGTASTDVAGAAQLGVETASVSAATARAAGTARAEASASAVAAVAPSATSVLSLGLSLRGLVVAAVRAFGRIVRFVPVPVLGVRVVAVRAGSTTADDPTVAAIVLDTRVGTVTAAHDSVAVRMVVQQAASCARVG